MKRIGMVLVVGLMCSVANGEMAVTRDDVLHAPTGAIIDGTRIVLDAYAWRDNTVHWVAPTVAQHAAGLTVQAVVHPANREVGNMMVVFRRLWIVYPNDGVVEINLNVSAKDVTPRSLTIHNAPLAAAGTDMSVTVEITAQDGKDYLLTHRAVVTEVKLPR